MAVGLGIGCRMLVCVCVGVHRGEQSLMRHRAGSVFLLRAVGNLSEILGREGCVQCCTLQGLLLLCELKEVEIEEYEEPLHRLDKGEGRARGRRAENKLDTWEGKIDSSG